MCRKNIARNLFIVFILLCLSLQGAVSSSIVVANAAERYSPPKGSKKAVYQSGLNLDKMKGSYYTTKKEEYIETSRFILYLEEGMEVPVNVIEIINHVMDLIEKETGYQFYVKHVRPRNYYGMIDKLDSYFENAEKFKKLGGEHEKVEIVAANHMGYTEAYANDANGIMISDKHLKLSEGEGDVLIHELLHVAWLRNGCNMDRVLCEGFATYFTDCIIEKDKLFDYNLDSHDKFKNYDFLISEATMEEHFNSMTAGQSNYQLGFRLMHFIIEEYGLEAYKNLHKEATKKWNKATNLPLETVISCMKSQLSEDIFEAFARWHSKNLERFGDTDITLRGEWYCEYDSILTRYYGNAAHAVIPNTVTNIQPEAFNANNKLITVKIPDTVTSIGSGAFVNCTKLSEIVIPDSVTDLYTDVFSGCTGLKTAVLSKNLSKLRANLFWGCSSLKEIIIPEGVTELEACVFTNCSSLTTVILPYTLERIGVSCFLQCEKLKKIVIPSSVKSIGDNAFCDCKDLVIYGKINSYAQTYAKQNGIKFSVVK